MDVGDETASLGPWNVFFVVNGDMITRATYSKRSGTMEIGWGPLLSPGSRTFKDS